HTFKRRRPSAIHGLWGLSRQFPACPVEFCVENVQPGVYALSALLNVQSTSATSVASSSFVTGTISVISGGPVVATPEPGSAQMLGLGCMLLLLFWIQPRACWKIISTGAEGFFSRHSA